MSNKPFNQFCENNKHPIGEQLKKFFKHATHVLEVGTGTGQHAVHFAELLPYLTWHTADQLPYHEGINAWIDEANLSNIERPLELTLPDMPLPSIPFDAVFTANTAHIMQKDAVQSLMENISIRLPSGGVFCQYGPFIENGVFSSESNEAFHNKLIREGYGGYRDVAELIEWAKPMTLKETLSMPANNLMLVWQKP